MIAAINCSKHLCRLALSLGYKCHLHVQEDRDNEPGGCLPVVAMCLTPMVLTGPASICMNLAHTMD